MEVIEAHEVAGAGGCFRKGARIQLRHGKTAAIEDLKVGDEVLSFNEKGEIELAKVSKTHYHDDPQPILRVKFWRGETHITPNHWVLNQYGGFAEVARLTEHDALVDGMGHLAPIMGMELVGHEPVYNLTVEPNHTFICDGVRVHNGGYRARFPEVAGAGGDDKGSGGTARAAVEDDDSAQSRSRVAIIDLLGEGMSGGLVDGAKSIFVNDTPLQNADGTFNWQDVEWDFRPGTLDQAPMDGFPDVESPYSVNVQVKTTSPAVVSITNPLSDQVRMVVNIPSMTTQDQTNGDIHGNTVTYRFDISLNGGAYQIGQEITLSYKARSQTQRQHLLTLPKSGGRNDFWTVRMVRISPDSDSATSNNSTYLDSYAEIINARLNYPGSVLVGLRLNSEYFSSIPSRSYLVRGSYIRVPSNYDPSTRTYSGTWDGTFKLAVSGNPAWITFDVLTDKRHGLGQYINDDQVDIAALYQIGRYCDEMVPDGMGGFEPRFVINTQIQTQVEAYQFLSDMTSAFRGMMYWSGSQVGFTQDRPGDPVMVYTPANVIQGKFTRSGSERSDRHSVVRVKWNDPSQNFKQNVEYVEDPDLVKRFGIRPLDTVAFGCTSRGQAHRVGLWVLYTERYESVPWEFSVGMDSALVMPGEVVAIHDPVYAGKRMGGRAKATTSTSITLDAPVTLGVPGASVKIRMPDGTFSERFVNERTGTFDALTWASPLTAAPVPGAIWVVTEPDLEPVLARVLNVQQGDNPGEFKLTVLQHNPSKYGAIEDDLKLEEPKISILDTRNVATPTDFKVLEAPIQVAPGVMGLSLILSWASNASYYEITWRRIGKYETNWETITTTNPMLELPNVRAGQHQFKIVAINAFGRRSQTFTASYTTVGRTAAPGDVANFVVTKRTSDLLLTWDQVTDITLKGYEVRVGPSWDDSELITTNFAGTMITHDQDEAGTYYYQIRSINVEGEYSDNVSTFKLVLDAPQAVEGFGIIQSSQRLELAWKVNPEPDISYYEIREGETWATGILVAQVNSTGYSIPSGTIGTRTFWIKAVESPGIYSDLASFVTTAVAMPTNSNIVYTTEESLLDWPGYRVNLREVGFDLMMTDGSSRAEYGFGIDLLDDYLAQNSVFAKLNSVVADTDSMTWAASAFTWADADALRSWAPKGSIESVLGRYQIARKTGLQTNEIDGWTLRDNTTSIGGKNASTAKNLVYEDGGRYGKGIHLKDNSVAEWASYSVDGPFTYTMNAVVKGVQEGIEQRIMMMRNPSTGTFLKLSYNQPTGSFVLVDNQGRAVNAQMDLAVGDVVTIGISQSDTERRLFVQSFEREPVYQAAPIPPNGVMTNIAINWPT